MSSDVTLSNSNASTQLSDRKHDTLWVLSLYGTAIGAGTLFLPIDAGIHGMIPLLVMTLLAFPLTFLPHRALCRFVLSGATPQSDLTEVAEQHFGKIAGHLLTFLYFFAIYPILLMYSVGLTNTLLSFITNQLGLTAPHRAITSLIIIAGLMSIVRLGQETIIKSISVLVYPFISILMLFAVYLIPHWNTAVFTQHASAIVIPGDHPQGLGVTLWLLIPLMIFSFSHTPIISSFAMEQKLRFGEQTADTRCNRILKLSHTMMVISVMFFVFSCVLSLSPHDLALAKQQNIPILSYLANHFKTPLMAYVAPFIAFIAISKSFLGHYLGAREGMHGLIAQTLRARRNPANHSMISQKAIKYGIEIFMLVTCWITATINPNILKMIESLIGPVIALILYIMPMYAVLKVPSLKKYNNPLITGFILVIGCVAITAIIYGLI